MERSAARVGDVFTCACMIPMPHVMGVVVGDPRAGGVPTRVEINGRVAAGRGDLTMCESLAPGWLIEGAAAVFVQGRALAGVGDEMCHGGTLRTGSDNVKVGDRKPPGVTIVRRGHVTVVVNSVTRRITLVGLQEYEGDGATEDFVARAIADIRGVWSGCVWPNGVHYVMEARITGRIRRSGHTADPNATVIHVWHTDRPPWDTSRDPNAVSNQPAYGREPGLQSNHDVDDGHTPAHEFGHAMGLRDTYITVSRPKDPVRETRCDHPQDIMCSADGNTLRPTPQAVHALITGEGLLP